MNLQEITTLANVPVLTLIRWCSDFHLDATLRCNPCNQGMELAQRIQVHVDGYLWYVYLKKFNRNTKNILKYIKICHIATKSAYICVNKFESYSNSTNCCKWDMRAGVGGGGGQYPKMYVNKSDGGQTYQVLDFNTLNSTNLPTPKRFDEHPFHFYGTPTGEQAFVVSLKYVIFLLQEVSNVSPKKGVSLGKSLLTIFLWSRRELRSTVAKYLSLSKKTVGKIYTVLRCFCGRDMHDRQTCHSIRWTSVCSQV